MIGDNHLIHPQEFHDPRTRNALVRRPVSSNASRQTPASGIARLHEAGDQAEHTFFPKRVARDQDLALVVLQNRRQNRRRIAPMGPAAIGATQALGRAAVLVKGDQGQFMGAIGTKRISNGAVMGDLGSE
ncbi:hypothetical protein QWZ10_22975 [Paracoccus cavernae]|uniref:Uncharacterized protein n=1 Tax=Paracoccus cavernae TaxID=1571207 RepID=A0ABT8DBW7_9RHOB|nr:hypothetical protein [Paracoccus cavernae]